MEWTKKEVDDYVEMLGDYDNSFVLDIFKKYIKCDKSILELGFGTGIDYLKLKEMYDITASDYSKEFIKRFEELYGETPLHLDALLIDVNTKFDCIYSNKVLQVFNDDDLEKTFARQYDVLNEHGFIFHTLWYDEEGNSSVDHCYNYINLSRLKNLLDKKFNIIKIIKYSEIDKDDSIIVIAEKM